MADPDASIKKNIASFLEEQGLGVEEVPRASIKTPDLLIEAGTSGAVLMEIKSKTDNPEEIRDLVEQMKTGRVVEHSKPTSQWDRLDSIIKDGVAQLTTHDPGRERHHVIWFELTGLDAAATELRLQATLYGTRKLFSTSVENLITAYYFSNCSFFRHRESLDAVVISLGVKAGLCLNGFSSRLAAMQGSRFTRVFSSPFLPEKIRTRPDVMICDAAAPRGNEQAMLEYLRNKYAVDHLQTMDMGLVRGMIRTPDDPK